MQPPEGYDSIYIAESDDITQQQQRRQGMSSEQQLSEHLKQKITHTYAIFSNEKISLLYRIVFKIGIPSGPKFIFCDICKR